MSARRRYVSREEQIIRKREKEYQHQKYWGDQQKYYDRWEQKNSKYEEWTSPRYYDANNQLVRQVQMEKAVKESLERRKENLRKLFEEDRQAWASELMEKRQADAVSPRQVRERPDDIPTEILKQVHQGLAEKEEEKRKKEAELRLYHQWRNNNSFVQEYERAHRSKDIKLSWLHQQMVKRERKEKEQEEERRFALEKEERLLLAKEMEEEKKREIERRNKELKEIIDKQVEEMQLRQTASAILAEKEVEERRRRDEVLEMEEEQKRLEKVAKQRETALFNVRQYKMKLKLQLKNIQEGLEEQERLMRRVKEAAVAESIEDERLKSEVKRNIEEFLKTSEQQKKLEKSREEHLQFMFDSEAQSVYDRQVEQWNKEEKWRVNLIRDVLATVARQIEENCRRREAEREEMVREREVLAKMNQDYNCELEKLEVERKEAQLRRKQELDVEVRRRKEITKAGEEEDKLKKLTEELERVKIEEEMLKREIMNMHRGQGLCRPSQRSNIIF